MLQDIEKVMFSKEDIKIRVEELGEQITKDYAGKDLSIIGILKGAFVFTSDLVRAISMPLTVDFMMVSSYGLGSNSSGNVKILKDIGYDIAHKHVLICEDIIDSGITMHNLMAMLKARRPASINLCALLTKPERREITVNIDYCGWSVPDEFLVGYGLDYSEKYRNLPFIGVLKREIYS